MTTMTHGDQYEQFRDCHAAVELRTMVESDLGEPEDIILPLAHSNRHCTHILLLPNHDSPAIRTKDIPPMTEHTVWVLYDDGSAISMKIIPDEEDPDEAVCNLQAVKFRNPDSRRELIKLGSVWNAILLLSDKEFRWAKGLDKEGI